MGKDILQTGKLNIHVLGRLLQRYSRVDEKVLVGPRIGEDAAAIDMGEKALIVTTDPITFVSDESGYYSVMVNANDIATRGAAPRWYTVTILLPEAQTTERLVESLFRQIHQACEELDITLIGGHTEITYGLDRPLIVGQMLGEVKKEGLITTAGARPEDLIIMSKGICIEGTAIIAREKGKELASRGISKNLIERAQRFVFDPGISVVAEARCACQAGHVHSMHDITEGGLINGLHEISMAAGVEVVVEQNRVPIYKESQILCEAFGLNPLGVIASGALLITASPPEVEKIMEAAHRNDLTMTTIGRIEKGGGPSVTIATPQGYNPLPAFERDEIVKIFEEATDSLS